jgi:cbb3-type cytochrome oxidase subunit 3
MIFEIDPAFIPAIILIVLIILVILVIYYIAKLFIRKN